MENGGEGMGGYSPASDTGATVGTGAIGEVTQSCGENFAAQGSETTFSEGIFSDTPPASEGEGIFYV